MSTYIVDLTVSSDSLDERSISEHLGIEATRFFRKGELRAPGAASVREQSAWVLEVLPSIGKEWPALEDGLTALLERLEREKTSLQRIAAQFDVTIVCGCFHSSFGAGPTLSPNIIQRLAELGVKLHLQNYWDWENSEQRGTND